MVNELISRKIREVSLVKICALQMNSSPSVRENLDFIINHLDAVKSHNATHLFLPENANFIHSDKNYSLENAENNPESFFLMELSQKAKEYKIFIHIGSIKYRTAEDKIVNRSISLSDKGEVIGFYDKIHLFDVVLSETEFYKESEVCSSGNEAKTCLMEDFKLGYSICYDIRFPFLYQKLRDEAIDVIAIPAAFTVPTGKAHWEALLRARAIETQSYIVASAQVGIHEGGRETYGHSMIIDPWGKIIVQAGGESTGIIFAEIDKTYIDEIRRKMPIATHRINFFS